MDGLIKSLEDMFKKLPALPAKAIDVLVMITPWIALIFGILGVLSALTGLGVLTAFAPLAVAGAVGGYGLGYVALAALAISSVLMLVAFPGLKKVKAGGWRWLFYSEVASVIGSLVSISLGGIIGALIGFYLLFQIKSRYK